MQSATKRQNKKIMVKYGIELIFRFFSSVGMNPASDFAQPYPDLGPYQDFSHSRPETYVNKNSENCTTCFYVLVPCLPQDIVPKKIKYSEYLEIIEKENKEEDDLY
jgi:hypothetical protein